MPLLLCDTSVGFDTVNAIRAAFPNTESVMERGLRSDAAIGEQVQLASSEGRILVTLWASRYLRGSPTSGWELDRDIPNGVVAIESSNIEQLVSGLRALFQTYADLKSRLQKRLVLILLFNGSPGFHFIPTPV